MLRTKKYIIQKIQIMIHPDPKKLLNQWCELIARFRNMDKSKL